ncbi:glycosyltransferase family 2 protein [Cellulomonas sp. FA1]|jgi:glycosyltransferase involved in cell wall biosynthesis|uniref:glycosyltransferase family 2 protein n=1 Tax=Cellulomonas sp. FA1 TaxID=1346710 RepID=UPI000625B1EF|nr:glycosyltransferase family 2 protein [Cellulomonas sp. FA1]
MPSSTENVELSILMPCLNEAETLAVCIRKAQQYLERSGIVGEVVIADNGSTDGSQDIARSLGARVVPVAQRGYGAALIGGTQAARGRYVIMGDADDSYDFSRLDAFVEKLREGYQLVMGNRFRGGIAPGAMPPLHKYLGNPVLSGIGRLFFNRHIRDFHCGMRGYDREAVLRLRLVTTGMEYASEMVVRASLAGLAVTEVPTTLDKDGRSRPPHLRSWRDGWRHLRFLLLYAPRWLFLYPGLVALTLGGLSTLVLMLGPREVGGIGFDSVTMIYTSAITVLGYQAVVFSILTKLYAAREGFLPVGPRFRWLSNLFTLERGLVLGLVIFVLGLVVGIAQVLGWGGSGFGELDTIRATRVAVPVMLGLTLGFFTLMASMFAGALTVATRSTAHPTPMLDIPAVDETVAGQGEEVRS